MMFHLHKLFMINCGCVAGFDPQGLSGTAWALAQLGLADAPFFCAMAEAVPRRFAELGALEDQFAKKPWIFMTLPTSQETGYTSHSSRQEPKRFPTLRGRAASCGASMRL